MTHLCPRRKELPFVPKFASESDSYDSGHCSWCGSMPPDAFMQAVESGEEIIPTDKDYKVYVNPDHRKFYFQHLSPDQGQRFVDLLNAGKLNIGPPGHFYVMPFFISKEPRRDHGNP